jgi:hypothetical protein
MGGNMPETNQRRPYHEVKLTKDLRSTARTAELVAFIKAHIAEFKGKISESHPVPAMLFDKPEHAREFADELSKKLNIEREHIMVKSQKQGKLERSLPGNNKPDSKVRLHTTPRSPNR